MEAGISCCLLAPDINQKRNGKLSAFYLPHGIVATWSQSTVGLIHGGNLRLDHALLQGGIVERFSQAVAVVSEVEDSLYNPTVAAATPKEEKNV